MGTGVPLLNDYKREFVWKRIPQTFLGGPQFRLGFCAPCYIYLVQLLLLFLPWMIGGSLTAAVELADLKEHIAAYIFAGLMFVYVLVTGITSEIARQKHSSVSAVVNRTNNFLAEDDDVEFHSCCGIGTVEFLLPGKKLKLNIVFHALVAGVVCGLGLRYLLLSTLSDLYGNRTYATVLVFIFGWFTLCIAQYPLTVTPPPETAIFRTTDAWEIGALKRPFYVLVFFSFDLIAREHDNFQIVNQVLHILFLFLPLFWLLGVLPPLEALVPWAMEQILVMFFGGSAMVTWLRLILHCLAAVCIYLILLYTPWGLHTVIIAATAGYILSLDLPSLFITLVNRCRKHVTPRALHAHPEGLLWSWTYKEGLLHGFLLILVGGVTIVINVLTDDVNDIADYLSFGVAAMVFFEVTFTVIQQVYFCGSFLRNPLFPTSVQRTTIFQKGKKRLKPFGIVRRICLNFVSPIVMLCHLSASFHFSDDDELNGDSSSANRTSPDAAHILGVTRAFRWVWQSSVNSLIEISVALVLRLALSDTSWWRVQGLGVQLMLIGLIRDRLQQLMGMLYYMITLLVTSWSDKKQRHASTIPLICCNIILAPVVLIIAGLASALSAPLLALFTLPVFLIGFSRPNRFWPGEVGGSSNKCPDTVYYRSLAPELALSLRQAFAQGSLGYPEPGSYWLVRFQDRMAWITVLEKGYMFCTISIKGLELQETSCHTAEAARIDDIFEGAFESGKPCGINRYVGHTLTPRDVTLLKTYSDARNQLTGVIDSPDLLRAVVDNFPRTLAWGLLHHIAESKGRNPMGSHPSSTSTSTSDPVRPASSHSWQKLNTSSGKSVQQDDLVISSAKAIKRTISFTVHADVKEAAQRSQSVQSFPDSLWSIDSEAVSMEPIKKQESKKMNLLSGLAGHVADSRLEDQSSHTAETGFSSAPRNTYTPGTTTNDNLDSLFNGLDLGLPVVDVNQERNVLASDGKKISKNSQNVGPYTCLGSCADFKSTHSSQLSLPPRWLEVPVEPHQLACLMSLFPMDWYQHVIGQLSLDVASEIGVEEAVSAITQDEALLKMHSQFIMACCAIVNVLGVSGGDAVALGPGHLFRVFSGDIPWSLACDWLNSDSELVDLVTKAYRFAVKLSLDQLLLGPFDSHEELCQELVECDRNWYIGSERDIQWAEAIMANKKQLFSLSFDNNQNTYHSRVLSLQEVPVYIGSLSDQAVRATWANLNLELLYMTNDDEERYSIQAHPSLLRNLTTQAADPPLGYPIYASPTVSLPTL